MTHLKRSATDHLCKMTPDYENMIEVSCSVMSKLSELLPQISISDMITDSRPKAPEAKEYIL